MKVNRQIEKYLYAYCLTFVCLACTDIHKDTNKLFIQLSSDETGVDFSNNLPLDDELNVLNYIYYFNGGGVAAGDLNNDGLLDLFFTGNQVSNEMYINEGNFKFKKSTKDAGLASIGWSSGVSMVDINADGWLDIYVCQAGSPNAKNRKNLLYINQKNSKFKEMAVEYGLADESYSTQATFFDYDLDGDLDMYLLNHMHKMEGLNQPKQKKINGESKNTDKLYRNNGVGANGHPTFTDVSQTAGITIEGYGLGVGISDFDKDGFTDIYVSNDFVSNDVLYWNQGDGTFKNRIAEFIGHQSHNGMGNDLADINNDGLTDIIVMDMLPTTNERQKKMLNKPNYDFYKYNLKMGYQPQYMRNTLQLNQGIMNGITHFGEVGQYSGISSTDWSWAALLADYDLDGQKDLYVTNGYLKDMTDLDFINYRRRQSIFRTQEQADSLYLASIVKLPEVALQNYFFRNKGDLKFKNVSDTWVPHSPGFSNGAIYADLDNDGDLDLVTNNLNETATILKNTIDTVSPEFNYLTVLFQGDVDNPKGIGAKVWTYSGGGTQFAENYTTRGFQSSIAPNLNFGFGYNTKIDSLKVIWPDGKSQILDTIKLNQKVTLFYSDAIYKEKVTPLLDPYLFTKSYEIKARHEELDFSDYRIEPLLPHKFSNDGPSIAVADINGDGMDDLYIGGSYNFSGQLFTQSPNSSFQKKPWINDIDLEDLGALFLDVDNDGDEDLYVVSGSNEFGNKKSNYQDRLYLNDGSGTFTKNKSALPVMDNSSSCISAADFDRDGQLDLFVGGRVVPGDYGQSPKSVLLKNKNGIFEKVTQKVLPSEYLGMVTASLWTDIDNDGWVDLMVVGEWMPITIFKNNNGELSEKIEIENSSGWWNSINGGDFDNDGDIDYIAGNLGENSVFKASKEYPLELYRGDFDKDGRIDPIITRYYEDDNGKKRSYPFASRDLLADQMVDVKTKFQFYADYAQAQISDFITKESKASLEKLSAVLLSSCYIENLGDGGFKIHRLPWQSQLSPVMGTTISDFNQDGNLDVLLTGNFYHNEVGQGRYDASKGLLLTGNGQGGFSVSSSTKNGFFVNGDGRALTRLSTKNGYMVIASQNNDSLITYHHSSNKMRKHLPKNGVYHGILTNANGSKRKIELYKGEGYLSQSTNIMWIHNQASIQWGEIQTIND
tara:strand:+ start:13884 stop:17390 length:3507 start_codon:yes stop_codon:yes gene_type:complete